jgi:hypothetical protein
MRRLMFLDTFIAILFCLWVVPAADLVVSALEGEAYASWTMANNSCLGPPGGAACAQGNGCPNGCAGTNNSCQGANGTCTTGAGGCSVLTATGATCFCNPFSC